MTPVRFTLPPFRRGEPPRLSVQLFSRNVRSGLVRPRPDGTDDVAITIDWPGSRGRQTKKLSDAAAGLTIDPRTRLVTYPLAASDFDTVPAARAVPVTVRIINAAGESWTFAEGSMSVEGDKP